MPRLIVFDDQVRGVDLPEGTVIIGRSKKSDVPIRDTILSRKHCAIVATGDSYRVVDLKSSNGTFLNGSAIDKAELSYDDVIEIGNTVMVFMESEVWQRGEGLARLRNPVKAQELIQRIRLNEEKKKRIPVRRLLARKRGAERARDLIRSVPLLDGDGGDAFIDVLEDFGVYKTMSLLLRNRPEIRRLVAESIENALISVVSGGWQELRPKLREELEKRIGELERKGGLAARHDDRSDSSADDDDEDRAGYIDNDGDGDDAVDKIATGVDAADDERADDERADDERADDERADDDRADDSADDSDTDVDNLDEDSAGEDRREDVDRDATPPRPESAASG
jgi:pSer/pThr/pTyr-binding forkhead associated (FHA) protein